MQCMDDTKTTNTVRQLVIMRDVLFARCSDVMNIIRDTRLIKLYILVRAK